jgi:phosphoglycolate phosphatase
MSLDTALFDLDGTLVDFHFPIVPSRLAMIDYLKSKGFDCSKMSEQDRTQDIIDKAEVQASVGEPKVDFRKVKLDLCKLLDDFEFEAFGLSKIKPYALQTLEELKRKGRKLALITNGGRAPTVKILDERNLTRYFPVVVTRDEVNRLKPSGEGIKKAIQNLPARTESSIFIGDSVIDVLAARDAGVKVAVIPEGSTNLGKLSLAGPDYLLNSLRDCLDLL